MAENDKDARERNEEMAAALKASHDMMANMAMLIQQSTQNAQQFNFTTSDNSANLPTVHSKTEQIRDLMAQIKDDDPVFALRTFFEGSTIIESYHTKHDIANLDTLEED
jgi:hypothetical protein